MIKLQKLKQAVRKTINPCEDCEKEIYIDSVGNLIKDICSNCSGKGYIEDL